MPSSITSTQLQADNYDKNNSCYVTFRCTSKSAPPEVLLTLGSQPGAHQPVIIPVLNFCKPLCTHKLHVVLEVCVWWVHPHEAVRTCVHAHTRAAGAAGTT